jgi:dolichol phosphate-mannose biosynthesis regulatory protein
MDHLTILQSDVAHEALTTHSWTNLSVLRCSSLRLLSFFTTVSGLFSWYIQSLYLRYCQKLTRNVQPFVDSDHPLQNIFPPRVWAIRIPVILILLGSAVVGSFLSVVMIRSNRKRAAKAKAAGKKKA